jgi:hypothetical protein
MDWPASKGPVNKLISMGYVNVYACEIQSGDGMENAGHLSTELPPEKAERKIIFKANDRLARRKI